MPLSSNAKTNMQIIVAGTNLQAMFKANGNILSRYGEDAKRSVPENIKGQSVLSVLKTMFGKEYFSICELTKLQELHNIEISDEHSKWMNTLHCVNYTDMHPDTREYLFAILTEYFKPIISMSYAA